ncbi:single strand DNA binding protein [Streptomyces phage Bmoc]|uniref:DNA binding protein n=1 Tax=Streptomyces phage Bmoc TaxID=2725629 RepID=A0A6M3SXU4_9CAUD|nr:single strand DNA binding protein [Streptomyces phage Bmoc]QJD50826.1 DNA binding protein [Streptomyces phage Bmoc]
MGTLKGLAAIRAYTEKQAQAAKEREDRLNAPKVEYLNLSDGQSVRVRFLQEMDPESENYDKTRGTGTLAVEHVVFVKSLRRMYRATCTIEDEGRCYGCERARAGDKEFAQKRNYYINALVDFMDGEAPKTMIVSRGMGSTFFAQLFEEAEEGTITESNYKITRKGSGTDTKWLLKVLPKDEPLDDSEAVVHDIDDEKNGIIRSFPYEATNEKASQEQYFNGETYNDTKSEDSESREVNSKAASTSGGASYDMNQSW